MAAPASRLAPLPGLFARGLELIDEAHSRDPNKTDGPDGPGTVPYELHYARKMTGWLAARCPAASPELQLACRAQHFQRYEHVACSTRRETMGSQPRAHARWQLPRSAFPMTRPGYLGWRAKQKAQAASQVVALLAEAPLPLEALQRIAALVRKEALATDAEAQVLEDVACLVFLDDQLDSLASAATMGHDKLVAILAKTWAKMSAPARELALAMDLGDRARLLLQSALEPPLS